MPPGADLAVNEADTCRKYVVPQLVEAGWDTPPYSFTEQRTFTDGRIIPIGAKIRRGKQKRADYLLRYRRDFPIAVVEAKADYKSASDGIQQAKDYAETLGLKFAYSTNGNGIIEFDFMTGQERCLSAFPSPEELWSRLHAAKTVQEGEKQVVLASYNLQAGKIPRYYQDIAINRAVEAIIRGKRRVLLTMATGTGKTATAFQICWKLWSTRWNRDRRFPPAENPLPGRSQRSCRRSDDQGFRAVWRCPAQDRVMVKLLRAAKFTSRRTRRSRKMKAGPACTASTRLTSSILSSSTNAIGVGARGQHLAGDPPVLQAGRATGNDRHAAAR